MFRRLFYSLAITFYIQSVELPQSQFILKKSGFTVCYDARLKQAAYVIEVLTKESVDGPIERDKFRFNEDPELPKKIRSTLSDYHLSSFDKGHLAPAGDFRSDESSMRDSFYLSNISPQTPSLNRGQWLKLERHVRQLARDHGKVTVFTGPVFLAKKGSDGKKYVYYQVLGDNEVAVPTHFFKVIQTEEATEAYILPNESISSNKPLSTFKETLEKVSKVSGLVFKQNGLCLLK